MFQIRLHKVEATITDLEPKQVIRWVEENFRNVGVTHMSDDQYRFVASRQWDLALFLEDLNANLELIARRSAQEARHQSVTGTPSL